ncbi:mandelate racemase/muconate lactonizing enzyme family protein [Halotalea alkalilenta]|uniref:mandelate racemase/muconate lactonizing enzyme family protein n=1 Tax=Halotalea alkalilenta TaxID=376489 RepID=UPI00048A4077|nr:mandelate racemase/muconate lactonizing enzyme family protein [Halotalea alkalilenta]
MNLEEIGISELRLSEESNDGPLALIALHDRSGNCGMGCIAATPLRVKEMLRGLSVVIETLDVSRLGSWLSPLSAAVGRRSELAVMLPGLDLALCDLHARQRGAALGVLLGGSADASWPALARLPLSRAALRESRLERLWSHGFRAFLLECDTRLDIDEIARLRARLGGETRLAIDARGCAEQDLASGCAALAELGVDWLEPPLVANDLARHVELSRRSSVAIAAPSGMEGWINYLALSERAVPGLYRPNLLGGCGPSALLGIGAGAVAGGNRLVPIALPSWLGLATQLHFSAALGTVRAIECAAAVGVERRGLDWRATLPKLDASGRVGLPSGAGLGRDPDGNGETSRVWHRLALAV